VLASLGIYVCSAGFILSTAPDAAQPEQATRLLEMLDTEAGRLHSLPFQTTHEIKRLLSQPQFDCRRTSCEGELRTRNLAVRARLEERLAGEVDQVAAR
jgi:hypothetical protein